MPNFGEQNAQKDYFTIERYYRVKWATPTNSSSIEKAFDETSWDVETADQPL